ncbi:MAG TPA: cyclic nucleotide-binding domain-containing protein [Caldilineae bacterium]|nr:cyclic nucleotide-binding domain-containing protein [Caldilineae bacterium]
MISPEVFRRSPFFTPVDEEQLTRLAMISEEEVYQAGETIFKEGEPAEKLYLILNGAIELWMRVDILGRSIPVEILGPGEVVGWSTLVSPYRYTASGEARVLTQVVAIDSMSLRQLAEEDHVLGYHLYRQVAGVIAQRLHDTRLRLASLLPAPVEPSVDT